MNIPDEAAKRYPEDYKTIGGNADRRRSFAEGAAWARREALREAADLAMRTGDERVAKARSEQERGRSLRPDHRKAQLAEDHAWALRNQADGLWEAANAIRALAEGEQG